MKYLLCELRDNHNINYFWKCYMLSNILLHTLTYDDFEYNAYYKEITQIIEVCYYTLYKVFV